jgi:hypothetical protein
VKEVAHRGMVRAAASCQVVFVTLTAPSAPHCMNRNHKGQNCKLQRPTCRRCDCSVDDFDVAAWNVGHARRKNNFITCWRRGEFTDGVPCPTEYFDGIEPQDGKRSGRAGYGRYALHHHLILVIPAGVQLNERAMKKVAIRLGFGHEFNVQVVPGYSAAAKEMLATYASKMAWYVSKAADERGLDSVPWLDDPEQPNGKAKGYCWRSWTASRKWGVTMAEVRASRRWRPDDSVGPALPAPPPKAAFNISTESYARQHVPAAPEPPPPQLFDPGGRGEVIV